MLADMSSSADVWPRYLVHVWVVMEVLDQPVIYVVWDVHLGEFIEQCCMSDSVEGFAKVQGNDDDKLVCGEEVGDGVQYGDKSSWGWTRWAKGELITEREERRRVKKCWM